MGSTRTAVPAADATGSVLDLPTQSVKYVGRFLMGPPRLLRLQSCGVDRPLGSWAGHKYSKNRKATPNDVN